MAKNFPIGIVLNVGQKFFSGYTVEGFHVHCATLTRIFIGTFWRKTLTAWRSGRGGGVI
jgi:hypothetical protein